MQTTIITSDLARVLRGFGIPPHVLAYTMPTTFCAVMARIHEAKAGDTILTLGERLSPGTLVVKAIHNSAADHIPVAIVTSTAGQGIYHAETAEELRFHPDFPAAPAGAFIYAVDSFGEWLKLYVGHKKAPAEAFELSLSA
jgi:hypothetical protein